MSDERFTVSVDFDGVIHSYDSPWVSAEVIPDPPVPGAIAWLNEIERKFDVVIHTTRGATDDGRHAVREWLVKYGFHAADRTTGNVVKITNVKPAALVYLDDRAVRFDGKHFPTADEIHRAYLPWHKDPEGVAADRQPASREALLGRFILTASCLCGEKLAGREDAQWSIVASASSEPTVRLSYRTRQWGTPWIADARYALDSIMSAGSTHNVDMLALRVVTEFVRAIERGPQEG